MNKFVVINPLDEHTCLHCRMQVGRDVVTVEEAVAVPFERCTDPDGCRCYVALEQEKETE